MRFKKLKLSVGIAMIAFILVVGNIFLFAGLLKSTIQDVSAETLTLPDQQAVVPKVPTVETTVKTLIITTNDIPAVEATPPPIVTPTTTPPAPEPVVVTTAPQPQPVVIQTVRRTRAS